MNELILIAEATAFALVLSLGFLLSARTGRLWHGVIAVWLLLVLLTGLLTAVQLTYTSTSMATGTARVSQAEVERLHRLVNSFPDGTHFLFMIVMGWFYGVVAGAVGLRYRKFRGSRQMPTSAKVSESTNH